MSADARIRLKIMASATGPARQAWEQLKQHGPAGAPRAARVVGQYMEYRQQGIHTMGTVGFSRKFAELHKHAMKSDASYRNAFKARATEREERFKIIREQRQARVDLARDPLQGAAAFTPRGLRRRAGRSVHKFMNKKRFAVGGNVPFGGGVSLKGVSNAFVDALKLVNTGGDMVQALAVRLGMSGEGKTWNSNSDTNSLIFKHLLAEGKTVNSGLTRGTEVAGALTLAGITPSMSQAYDIGMQLNRLEVAKNSGVLHSQSAIMQRTIQNIGPTHLAVAGTASLGDGFDGMSKAGDAFEMMYKAMGGTK